MFWCNNILRTGWLFYSAIMSNQDLIQMEKEMETSSTEFSEITEISERILSSKTEYKYDFLCNKSNKIILKY